MSKHTPGPWVAIYPESRRISKGSDITNFCVLTEKTRAQFRAEGRDHYDRTHEDVSNISIVSNQFWSDMTDEEAKANARLIAAAPELLEALKIVDACGQPNRVELYDGEAEGWQWAHPDGREWHEVGCWEDPPPMHPAARAAITKAEGGTP